MGAAWRHRVARDEKGILHFVCARYRSESPEYRSGITGPWLAGKTIDEMREHARSLLAACDEPIISTAEHEDESGDYDEDEDARFVDDDDGE
jgi:hypothetical protein